MKFKSKYHDNIKDYPLYEQRLLVQQEMILDRKKYKGNGFDSMKWAHNFLRFFMYRLKLSKLTSRRLLKVKVRHEEFEFANLPEEFDGLRILHFSDTHIDGIPGLEDVLIRIVKENDFDLCIFTGDFRFGKKAFKPETLAPTIKVLKEIDCRLGTIGILGNHDFMEQIPFLQDAGMTVLLNESIQLPRGCRNSVAGTRRVHGRAPAGRRGLRAGGSAASICASARPPSRRLRDLRAPPATSRWLRARGRSPQPPDSHLGWA